ncbi:MAG TPA: hypothetical protein VH989_02085, partial [Actinomycetota bacterium]
MNDALAAEGVIEVTVGRDARDRRMLTVRYVISEDDDPILSIEHRPKRGAIVDVERISPIPREARVLPSEASEARDAPTLVRAADGDDPLVLLDDEIGEATVGRGSQHDDAVDPEGLVHLPGERALGEGLELRRDDQREGNDKYL